MEEKRMDKKELKNESLEKVVGGFKTFESTDKDGNTTITEFGVIHACFSCGLCKSVCPTESITIGPNGAQIDEGSCILCWCCADVCPLGAIGEKTYVIPAPIAK